MANKNSNPGKDVFDTEAQVSDDDKTLELMEREDELNKREAEIAAREAKLAHVGNAAAPLVVQAAPTPVRRNHAAFDPNEKLIKAKVAPRHSVMAGKNKVHMPGEQVELSHAEFARLKSTGHVVDAGAKIDSVVDDAVNGVTVEPLDDNAPKVVLNAHPTAKDSDAPGLISSN